MAKPYVDIAFVVPLFEEFERLKTSFPTKAQRVQDIQLWEELDLGITGFSAVAFLQDDMGKAAATRATNVLLQHYDVGVIIVIGIAGGLSGDAALGDVCFTGSIIDVLENSKITDGTSGSRSEFNSKFHQTDPRLSFALKYATIGLDAKPHFEDWQLEQWDAGRQLIPGEFIGRKEKNEILNLPQIHDGSIVCGSISKSEFYNSNLKTIERKVLAIETESGGVFHPAGMAGVPAVTIRGICDYADKNKNRLEEQTNNNTRQVAANNAISFVKMQLRNPQFITYLDKRRALTVFASTPLLTNAEEADLVSSALQKTEETIHYQLTQLSPEYRGKPQGYRLPLPRVRPVAATATVSHTVRRTDPITILEAVATHRTIVVAVPRNYPDNSLPWVIASELRLIRINGKQAIPVVINGEAIKPPHGTFDQHSENELCELHASDKARPIIIITDFPTDSRSRTEFLRQEMVKYPHAHFVIVNRADLKLTSESELVVTTGAQHFNVCEISFVEMTNFLQRTFKMPDQEAGVITLRLREMFRKFSLNAHPSFFAGVASEVLTSLLRANRRTELLQLAVSGFLSFVVASDTSNVVLSRTTREEFLRRFVFAQRVGNQVFDRAALMTFVEKYASEKDYDIEPISFINSFQEKGILHFEHGEAEISLPFIEAYLLASELQTRPVEAREYFEPSNQEFDFTTFDIYSELGANEDIVAAIVDTLLTTTSAMAETAKRPHILLTNDIRPAILKKQARLKGLEEKLERAFDDVVNNRPNSVEKQRILDIASLIEEDARSTRELAQRGSTQEEVDDLTPLDNALRIWSIATILLGSGSERLGKYPKRELALHIVQLSAYLLDGMLRTFPKVEFDRLREELKNDASLRELLGIPQVEAIDPDFKSFVGTIVDAYEFSLLGYPMRALFEQLGNVAGQAVLGVSIASVAVTDPIESLIARVWGAEICAAKEKPALLSAIRDLPPVPFLRYSLSQYFMMRVFWNHWEPQNRLALLDAAEETLKPLGVVIDKGRIQRMIGTPKSISKNVDAI